jgi:hypothetical protein
MRDMNETLKRMHKMAPKPHRSGKSPLNEAKPKARGK